MIKIDHDSPLDDAKTQFLSKILPSSDAKLDERLTITPNPGFVLKTYILEPAEKSKFKLFINICENNYIPAPPLTTDEELMKAIEAGDNSNFRVPLSLSQLKEDKDKAGNQCYIVDIVMNCDPYKKSLENPDFKAFMMELCLQWVEQKCNMKLDKNYSFPKLKSKGSLSKHMIRKPSKPLIAKLDPIIQTPEYTMLFEPDEKNPEYIILDVKLPLINTTKDTVLEIEKRRLILTVPNMYKLDIKLGNDVDTLEAFAQFDKSIRVLTITCMVLK